MGFGGVVLAAQHHFKVLSDVVRPLLTKPARDLKRQEAWTLIEYHVLKGELNLLQNFGKGNEERARLGTSVAGVQFMHAAGKNAGRFGSINAWKDPSFNPTAEFAIVLYRLAVWLKANWGATTIVWGGIGGASGRNASDCHSGGHCVDFYGANTSRGGVFDVARDWFYQPVYTKDGKIHAKAANDAWGNDTKTFFRLLTTNDAGAKDESDKSYSNPSAKDFFLDVFQFVANECNSSGDSSPAEMKAGTQIKYGVTMHPDYPRPDPPGGRRGHWDHMHFQLGDAIHKK